MGVGDVTLHTTTSHHTLRQAQGRAQVGDGTSLLDLKWLNMHLRVQSASSEMRVCMYACVMRGMLRGELYGTTNGSLILCGIKNRMVKVSDCCIINLSH